jgi:hypothetical protein
MPYARGHREVMHERCCDVAVLELGAHVLDQRGSVAPW